MPVALIVVRLKKAFQKLNRAVFIFQLVEVKVTKDCDNNRRGRDRGGYNGGGYNIGGCHDQGAVCQLESTVPFFRQYASIAFTFLTAFPLLIALTLQTNADASRLPIPIQLAYLASQPSFLPFSRIYVSYILSSSLVIKTFKSLFSNLLRLSLSLRLFILPTVITYSRFGAAVQSRVRLLAG